MDILVALYVLRDYAVDGEVPTPSVGICANLTDLLDKDGAYEFVKDNCSDWPFYSGNKHYPIGEREYNAWPRVVWQGKQLKYRISLIDHLIDKLESGEAVIKNDDAEQLE